MLDTSQAWQAVLGELELLVSKPSFTTWFKGSTLLSYDEQSAIVCVPNAFTKSWLENKFHPHILRALQGITQTRIRQIVYRVEVVRVVERRVDAITPATTVRSPNAAAFLRGMETAVATAPHEAPPVVNEFGINQRYVFNSFVVGRGNELAHAACQAVVQAVVENQAKPYNPLFIYGGVGLGKTHLLQAVGNAVVAKQSAARLRYVTCEQFMNDFIHTIRGGHGKDFHDRYRNVDLLLIDDIQFISGKEGTQEAFFHTFNHLHQNDKQVVLTSDRPPKAINALEARLLSRFEWGMIADIQSPDLETRLAILETKCRERNFPITSEVLRFFASSIQNNIRELEGALNKFIAYVQFHKVPASVEIARQIASQVNAVPRKCAITPKQLVQVVSEFFDVPIPDIVGKSRKKDLVGPRQIIMFLMREEIKSSYPSIGQELGGRDHTTAMHAYEKISNEIENNEKTRQDIQLIRQRLYA